MKEFLKRFILHNIWTKLFSILLAVVAWASIMNVSDPYISVTIRNISVQKENEATVTDENMIYDVVSGETVTVTYNGPRSSVQGLSADDILAYVDLQELSITNSCPIHVELKDKDRAQNVKLTSKSVEVMKLSLEQMVKENKQVVYETVGTPASGVYAEISVSPTTLEVYGSENAVSSVERLVAKVDIQDVSSTSTVSVEVYPVNSAGEKIESSAITIEKKKVEATITTFPTKNVNIVIETNISAMKGFTYSELKFAPDSVTIAGPITTLNKISELKVTYEKDNVNETINDNINLSEYIPEDCYLVSTPDFVSVMIPVLILDQNKRFELKLEDIEIKNLDPKFKLKNVSDELTVSVWGTEESVAELEAGQLGLYLDFSDILEAGDYKISLGHKDVKDLMFDEIEADVVIIEPEEENKTEHQNEHENGEE